MRGGKTGKILWLTWEKQIRNRSMAKGLDVPLFEVLSGHGRFVRYATCIRRTVGLLFMERPSVVICQNPSMALTLLLLRLRSFFGFRVAIDAHFGGIDASNGSNASQKTLDWCNRSAELVIVTNENHARHVRDLGGRAFICPDPLPDLSRYKGLAPEIAKKAFLICSYDVDEPFREVFKAAAMLASEGYRFSVSGKYQKAGISPQDYPHVDLLGFVPEDDFYRHLFTSQLVVDLTDNDDCLVCGAYEALEAGKPLILSKKMALQEYFTGGTVFTENKAGDIAAAVRIAYAERERLAEESRLWVQQAKADMEKRMAELNDILATL